jgi:hypothetical protein
MGMTSSGLAVHLGSEGHNHKRKKKALAILVKV